MEKVPRNPLRDTHPKDAGLPTQRPLHGLERAAQKKKRNGVARDVRAVRVRERVLEHGAEGVGALETIRIFVKVRVRVAHVLAEAPGD